MEVKEVLNILSYVVSVFLVIFGIVAFALKKAITEKISHYFKTKFAQENEKYKLSVVCESQDGDLDSDLIYFHVSLKEVKEFLILEDIGDYKYLRSVLYEAPEHVGYDNEINSVYFAHYGIGDYIYSVDIFELNDKGFFEEKIGNSKTSLLCLSIFIFYKICFF